MLNGTLINANFGRSTLIYLALINVACPQFLGANLYINEKMKLNCVEASKNEAKLHEGVNENLYNM